MTDTTTRVGKTHSRVLAALGAATRATILGIGIEADSCIFTSAVSLELLRRRGIAAEGLLVKVAALNAPFARAINRHGWPQSSADFGALGPEMCCRLLGYSRQHGRYVADDKIDGHVVVIVGGTHLFDASLDQLDVPDEGIESGMVYGPIHRAFPLGQRQHAVVLRQGMAIYEALPDDRSFTDDLDWTYRPFIDRMADLVDERPGTLKPYDHERGS